VINDVAENHWRTVDALMERLALDSTVRDCVAQTFERWDGKGYPQRLRSAELHLAALLVNLADVVEVFHQAGGVEAAVAIARERRSTQFDPELVDLFCDHADEIFAELDVVTSWNALMAVEPHLDHELDDDELDNALAAIADFVDRKSPYTLGHSRGVADLAERTAAELGLAEDGTSMIRRAGLVHDLGRLGVSNAIWEKPEPLSAGDWERVRLHPYLSERMLTSCSALAGVATVAGQHYERLDRSGYPGRLSGDAISVGGRVLGAADAYRARLEERPHRPAADPAEAAAFLREEARRGRLDGDIVEAVLRADGHRARRRRPWPAGLTTREVEILRLVARGLSHKEIAARLVISRKTASNHVERIYAKIGANNRAMAALFAVKHGLVVLPTEVGDRDTTVEIHKG
jgi:HD-GYP domain-containing protein (c-di-GMP phosphodiesterase class II)